VTLHLFNEFSNNDECVPETSGLRQFNLFQRKCLHRQISPGGTNLAFSTYCGGTNYDEGRGIAVDTNGFIYVTASPPQRISHHQRGVSAIGLDEHRGTHSSTNYVPITKYLERFFAQWLGQTDRQLRRLCRQIRFHGTNLLYSTFLGGANNDVANGIAVDNNGAALYNRVDHFNRFPEYRHEYSCTPLVRGHQHFARLPGHECFPDQITNSNWARRMWALPGLRVFGGKGADIGYGRAVGPGR